MNKLPDWEKAPEWANWVAMDEDGGWTWFEFCPISKPKSRQTETYPGFGFWVSEDDNGICQGKVLQVVHFRDQFWRHTLQSKIEEYKNE